MKIVEDLDRLRSSSMGTAPTSFVKSSLLYVQFIGHYYTRPGYSIERDDLDSFLLLVTIRGKGYLHYQGTRHELEQGKAFLIDCKQYHLYYTDPDDLWEFVWIHFNGNTAQDYVDYFLKLGGPLAAESVNDDLILDIQRIKELQKQRDERSDLLTSSILVRLITEILQSALQDHRNDKQIPPYITGIKQALGDRLQRSISLDDLSKEFAVSKYHLSREFKKYTGYSPYEYLLNLRMIAAKELLKTTDLTIEEITRRTGFTNATHFIHTFKIRENATPLKFRKNWQGKP